MTAIITGLSPGVLIMEDLIQSFQWQMFWHHKDKATYPVLEQVSLLLQTLDSNQHFTEQFKALVENIEGIHQDLIEFEKECEAKSELCKIF